MSRIYDAMRTALAEPRSRLAGALEESDVLGRVSPSAADGYRRAALACSGATERERQRVTLVVSSIPGEGTSTVARNLARIVSASEQTLLVDANLRAPTQHADFGVDRRIGLTEVLAQPDELDRALHRFGSLSLLASGGSANKAVDVPGLHGLRRLLEELRSRFDRIIVDGPPVTVYSEAASLASLSDGVVLVVQAERTRWHVAEEAKRTILASGARLTGAVLNRRRCHIPESIYRLL